MNEWILRQSCKRDIHESTYLWLCLSFCRKLVSNVPRPFLVSLNVLVRTIWRDPAASGPHASESQRSWFLADNQSNSSIDRVTSLSSSSPRGHQDIMEAAFFGERKILPWKRCLSYFVVWTWFHKAKRDDCTITERVEKVDRNLCSFDNSIYGTLVGSRCSLALETVDHLWGNKREERSLISDFIYAYVCRYSWWLQVGFMTPENFWKHGGLAEEKVLLATVAHHGQLSNGIQTRRYVGKRSENV